MFKKFSISVFILTLLAFYIPVQTVHAATGPLINYTTSGSPIIGNTIDININISNAADIYGASIDFVYDPSLIQVLSISKGDFWDQSNASVMPISSTSNISKIAISLSGSQAGVSKSSGKIAVIKARVLKEGALNLCSTPLGSDFNKNGNSILLKLSDSSSNKVSYTNQSNLVHFVPQNRLEESNSLLSYSSNWQSAYSTSSSSNTSKYSNTANSTLSFTFTGTGINVIGFKGKNVGCANITIDGASYSWDGYSSTDAYKQVLFRKFDLPKGSHNVTIKVTGTKNSASTNSYINLDAFDIIDGTLVTLNSKRTEENNSNIVYSGTWGNSQGTSNSASFTKFSKTLNSTSSFTFSGTGVNIIGYKGPNVGCANITIDGANYSWDGYSPTGAYNQVLFSKLNLAKGSHTVTIKVLNTKNSSATDSYVNLDAFDILDGNVISYNSTRAEEDDARLSYSANWGNSPGIPNSGNSSKFSNTANSYVSFSFNGTGINIIGFKGKNVGCGNINIDGMSYSWDGYSLDESYLQTLFQKLNLTNGTHNVTIKVTGTKNSASTNSYINLDAIDIIGGTLISNNSNRAEENSPNIVYSANWGNSTGSLNSGNSSKFSNSTGATASFTFNGTGLNVIGFKGKTVGLSNITIDGTSYSVDGYSSSESYNQPIFSKAGLANGTHNAVIRVTGTKNPSSTATYVNLDAFDVIGGNIISYNSTRLEDSSSSVKYSGTWAKASSPSSSGSASTYSKTANSSLSFTFTGTGINVIGFKGKNIGFATIVIDGTTYTWDGYSSNEAYKQVLFKKTNLSKGTHSVKITVTGTKNSSSTDSYVNLDAFDIIN